VLITAAVIVIKLQILITTKKTRNAAPIRIIILNPLVNCMNTKLLLVIHCSFNQSIHPSITVTSLRVNL